MSRRATWFCVVFMIFSTFGSFAMGQDDREVPGLGNRNAFGGVLIFNQPDAVPAPVAPVEDDLPDEAKAVLEAHEKEAIDIRRKAEMEISNRRDKAIKALKLLQDKYTKEAKLDEAVAIRTTIRKLAVSHLKPMRNPGNLSAYIHKIDQTFFFDVVGAANGMVWGSEVYTCDSALASAAVHAGVLKNGQRGIVKVTILRSPNEHIGSISNGIKTGNWGSFAASYTVESPQPTDVNDSDAPPNP